MRKRIVDKVARKKREKNSSDDRENDGRARVALQKSRDNRVRHEKIQKKKKQSSPEIFHTIHCSHHELYANAVPHFARMDAEKRWPIAIVAVLIYDLHCSFAHA